MGCRAAPPTAHSPEPGADDYWSATVPGVEPGQLYRFRITTADGEVLERLDAAARDVLSSELTRATGDSRNASLVPDRAGYPWAPFDPPRFENFLIYQFHVGTFAGRGDQHGDRLGDVRAGREQARLHPRAGLQLRRAPAGAGVRDGPLLGLQPRHVLRARVVVRLARRAAALRRRRPPRRPRRDLRRRLQPLRRPATTCCGSTTATPTRAGSTSRAARTPGGVSGPAWWKREVQDYFHQNARMYLEEYRRRRPPVRRDHPDQRPHLRQVVDRLRAEFPDRYLVAEHLPDDPWIIQRRPLRRHLVRRRPPRDPAGAGRAGSGDQDPRRARAGTATTTRGTW